MRTTITIAADVAAEIDRLRREEGFGPSEAMNLLARRGMARQHSPRATFVQRSSAVGIRVDVSNIGEVLDLLDETP